MEEKSVLVIGAGAAGLAGARALSQAGFLVSLLEARERLGGRILTIRGETGVPLELGAEFIHGRENTTWQIIRAAQLPTQKVPDRHWGVASGALVENPRFWEELHQVLGRINTVTPDQNFQSFLDQAWSVSPAAKARAKEYVEGFHAAPATRISIHALARAEAAAERDKATRQFRFTHGYAALLDWFARQLVDRQVQFHYSTRVTRIRWERGQVEVEAQTPAGARTFTAARALLAVPLGVLKADAPDALVFEPKLPGKEKAIGGLEMGTALKVTLEFRARFWPVENFGFLHSPDPLLPTWWSDERGPLLTGWTGGPKAQRLSRLGSEAIVSEALGALTRLFDIERPKLQELLLAAHTWDWGNDPFARGAYSYTPAGRTDLPRRLAAPVADTLFFAGEATDGEGEQGTVHAALASGNRAAKEIYDAARRGPALSPALEAGKK